MTTFVLIIFGAVYVGMMLGGLPFLQLDRTGVALLGAIALIGAEAITPENAAKSVHLPTLILLFSFMVISAQMRLGGFYAWVTRRLTDMPLSPPRLLAALIALVAALSAVFSNDIVCLAVAPVLIAACRARRFDPVPYLLALACAANIGSAATLIGNPQNILIGQTLELSFAGYFVEALVPVVLGLTVVWWIIVRETQGRWTVLDDSCARVIDDERREGEIVSLDRWQTTKGLVVVGLLIAVFLWLPSWPRDVAALTGAGVLLTSRKLHSTKMLGLVDWELLILFVGLFVVNYALQGTGLVASAVSELGATGVRLDQPGWLFAAVPVLSNLVSNVPAVMLLLPFASHDVAGPVLALASTLAGNLIIVGSIANIIVVATAARHGIHIDWRRHARIGVPVALVTLVIAAAWLRALGKI